MSWDVILWGKLRFSDESRVEAWQALMADTTANTDWPHVPAGDSGGTRRVAEVLESWRRFSDDEPGHEWFAVDVAGVEVAMRGYLVKDTFLEGGRELLAALRAAANEAAEGLVSVCGVGEELRLELAVGNGESTLRRVSELASEQEAIASILEASRAHNERKKTRLATAGPKAGRRIAIPALARPLVPSRASDAKVQWIDAVRQKVFPRRISPSAIDLATTNTAIAKAWCGPADAWRRSLANAEPRKRARLEAAIEWIEGRASVVDADVAAIALTLLGVGDDTRSPAYVAMERLAHTSGLPTALSALVKLHGLSIRRDSNGFTLVEGQLRALPYHIQYPLWRSDPVAPLHALRALIAQANDADHDAAVATAADLRKGAPLPIRVALAFVCAQARWAKEDAEQVIEGGAPIPPWSIPLLGALDDIDTAERLARGLRAEPPGPSWDGLVHMTSAFVSDYLPTLVDTAGVGAIHTITAARALGDWGIDANVVDVIDSPESIAWSVRFSGVRGLERYAQRLAWAAPELLRALTSDDEPRAELEHPYRALLLAALRHPDAAAALTRVDATDSAVLDELRAELLPEASDAELPALLATSPKKTPKLPAGIVPVALPLPRLADGTRVLSQAAFTRLLAALAALKGSPDANLDAALGALDPASLDVLGAALARQTEVAKWATRALERMGGPRTCDALAQLADPDPAVAKRAVPILQVAADGKARLEHLASKASAPKVRALAKSAL